VLEISLNIEDKTSVEKKYLCKSDFWGLLDGTSANSNKHCSKGQVNSHWTIIFLILYLELLP
jgi:hypothetical protein